MKNKQSNFFYITPFDSITYFNWEFRVKLLLEHQGIHDEIIESTPA